MTERQFKSLILFFLESIIMLGVQIINEDFAEAFNQFIYEQHKYDRKSLGIIFNIDKLDEFIEGKYDILTLKQIIQLIYGYQGMQNYIKLLDEIGSEDDKAINYLALLFSMKYQEIIKLRYANDSIYYPKGYPRILQ